jgi:hypothetical protein
VLVPIKYPVLLFFNYLLRDRAATMRTTKHIFALLFGAIGLGLIVRGAWGGVWPLSVQLVAGMALLVYAVVRWRTL